MSYQYSFKDYQKDTMAKALGRSMSISTKHSIEICSALRQKNVAEAKKLLTNVIEHKKPLPFKRFHGDVGHKPGAMAAGRYPEKASREILKLLELAEANAQYKGLNTSDLLILHISAKKGPTTNRFGRQRGRSAKRTNFEIVVQEQTPAKKEVKGGKKETKPAQEKKPATKVEAKPTEKKEVKAETKPAAKPAAEKQAPAQEKPKQVEKPAVKETPKTAEQPKPRETKQSAASESKPQEQKSETKQ